MASTKPTAVPSYTDPVMSSSSASTTSTIRAASPSSKTADAQAVASETTPLISSSLASSDKPKRRGIFPPINRVLFTSFLLSMTFAFTQTSLIYGFRLMTCEEYYKTHVWDGPAEADRCSIPRIEADSASSIALMSTMTTSSMVANLFVTGWFIKQYGTKAAMFQQTFWAALRNLCQIYSFHVGGATGIRIIQVTQLFNVLGSAGGYQIASNVFVSFLAPPEERTSMFGVLTGIIMLGSSGGYTFGGLAYNYFGILAPFQCAFALLCFCTIFGSLFLPYIPPDHDDQPSGKSQEKKKKSFLAPLKIFIPKRKIVDGKKGKYDFNLLLLGSGAFFSVLATGYVHMGLQLVGTDVFDFKPGQSGMMLSILLLVKAFFLSVCFPRIISAGRRWVSHRSDVPTAVATEEHPDNVSQAEEPDDVGAPRQDQPITPTDFVHGSQFDLHFLRWSIFVDGLLTALLTFSSHGWHLFLAAVVLPFASGTGSACKGVTLDFVPPEERADALGAIALVEKVAQVSTISIFGYAFAYLSEQGKPTLVFLVNGSIAVIAFLLLLFVRMPRPESAGMALP
ncbi:hypothetical protein CI109_105909 [Kwoniella shandongensis]|uniref:Uncharacterized protein n=1 Tax=Kwoniella shandongensis TaxID=1734106 RepID=A0A5M6BSB0_9TREE|nr:uncharacterized protein CI109_006661 [Kwoniella shandongensis]KAA5525021.1 hypothetical protein CI109_006661 [Kwoniella shandongensis]